MRIGMFPGQLQALRREVEAIKEEERQKGTRRMFLGAATGLIGGLAGGFGVGRWSAPEAHAQDADAQIESAKKLSPAELRALAIAPTPDLLGSLSSFFTGCEQAAVIDETVCVGLHRVITLVQEERVPQHRRIGDLLIHLAELRTLPASVSSHIALLPR